MSFAYLGPISGPKRNKKEKGLPLGRVLTDLENEFGSHQIIGDPQNGKKCNLGVLGDWGYILGASLGASQKLPPNIQTSPPTAPPTRSLFGTVRNQRAPAAKVPSPLLWLPPWTWKDRMANLGKLLVNQSGTFLMVGIGISFMISA